MGTQKNRLNETGLLCTQTLFKQDELENNHTFNITLKCVFLDLGTNQLINYMMASTNHQQQRARAGKVQLLFCRDPYISALPCQPVGLFLSECYPID